MKISLVMIFVAFLSGCSADTSSNTEPDKEPKMSATNYSQTYVIFSPMQGVLMQYGKPLSHTKIIRRLRWNGNDEEGLVEEFVTDEVGRFSLPIHEEGLSLGMLSQFVGKAELEVVTENGIETIWFSSKLMPELYSETGQPLNELVCDIEVEEIPVFIGGSVVPNIMTKCRWKNMPDE